MCLGTTAEGLKNPKTEVLPIVKYLGERGKIYQIHMRNIKGGLHNFQEVFLRTKGRWISLCMLILRYMQSCSLCLDHMPRHPNDPGQLQVFAFGYGYIKALIQAANAEV